MPTPSPTPAIFKILPSGPAWCCGTVNEKGQSCKGILATNPGHEFGHVWPEAPIGYMLSNGVWHRTKRQASRFTSQGSFGRELTRKQKQPMTVLDRSILEEQGLDTDEVKEWGRERVQSQGEEITEFPAVIKCPGCQKNGIILSVEAAEKALPCEPYN